METTTSDGWFVDRRVVGSGLSSEDSGKHELEGVGGSWRLLTLTN